MHKNVAIIHYNTPELTEALVRSVWKFTPDACVTIFDNSDRFPFPKMDGVKIIDNTRGQVVDFEAMISRYPERKRTINNYASAKHIASVNKLFDILPEGFLLLDSDVLLIKDLSELFDTEVAWSGFAEDKPDASYHRVRLQPYCLWINVPMLKQHGIQFWHDGMVDVLDGSSPYYDTGASLLHDCRALDLPGKQVDIYDYIIHFGRGSYGKTLASANEWLTKHKDLYE